jgi:hypothetical protein
MSNFSLGGTGGVNGPAPLAGRASRIRSGVSPTHPIMAALIQLKTGGPSRKFSTGLPTAGGGATGVTPDGATGPDAYATGDVPDPTPYPPMSTAAQQVSPFQAALQQRLPQVNANVQVSTDAPSQSGMTDNQKKALAIGIGAGALVVGYLIYENTRK